MTKKQFRLCEKILSKNKSSFERVTMMAFLFQGKSLLAQGINSEKTDPYQSKFRKKLGISIDKDEYLDKRHAEVDCLKGYAENKEINPKSLTLFVISKRADGTLRNSKPCPVCRKVIESIGIGEICYIYNGRMITEKLLD